MPKISLELDLDQFLKSLPVAVGNEGGLVVALDVLRAKLIFAVPPAETSHDQGELPGTPGATAQDVFNHSRAVGIPSEEPSESWNFASALGAKLKEIRGGNHYLDHDAAQALAEWAYSEGRRIQADVTETWEREQGDLKVFLAREQLDDVEYAWSKYTLESDLDNFTEAKTPWPFDNVEILDGGPGRTPAGLGGTQWKVKK